MIERTYRQQRLIPAFMEPRCVRRRPDRRADHDLVGHPDPAHPARHAGADHAASPSPSSGSIAPDVGGGFGGKLQVTPEESSRWSRPQARQAGQVHRDPQRVPDGGAPRPRPDPEAHARGQGDGTVTGLKVDLLADMGAYLGLVTPGVPILGAFMYNAIYKFPSYRFTCTQHLHQQELDRRLPWRRPAGGDVRDRADHGRARGRGRRRPDGDPARRTGSSTRSSRSPRWPAWSTTRGNYEAATAKAKELFGYDALRAEQKQRRDSGDPVQLGIGISTFTEMCGLAPSRVLGRAVATPPAAGSTRRVRMLADRQGRGDHRHEPARPGPRDGVEPDRRRPARASRSTTSRSCTATRRSRHRGLDTYGSRSLAVGGMAVVAAADKVIEKAKPIAAHMLEASVDDIEFNDGNFTVKGTDSEHRAWPTSRSEVFTLARPARRHRAVAGRRRDVRPGELLVPARHPPVRGRGRHRDR